MKKNLKESNAVVQLDLFDWPCPAIWAFLPRWAGPWLYALPCCGDLAAVPT